MMSVDRLLFFATFVAALGCGLIAGIFFAFSAFIMKALDRIMPSQGIAAMQSINVAVLNPLFLGVFLGTGAVCAVISIFAVFRWDRPDAVYLFAGGLFYLVGTFLVTMAFNVPRNNILASVRLGEPRAARVWAAYIPSWTMWNHVRTTASLVAMTLFILALVC